MPAVLPNTNPRPRSLLRTLLLAAPVLALLLSIGCAEQFTTARRSREYGLGLYRERNYGDAAGAFRNGIRQDPRDFESHYYLGVCYDEMNQHQQAFACYRTALDVMATTLGGKGEDEFRLQVLETFAKSIAQFDAREVELTQLEQRAAQGQKAEDWFLVAKVYRIRGDADKAIESYRKAVYYQMDNFAIRKEYGLYLLDPLNQRQDAENQLRAAWRLNGNDQTVVAALNSLGARDVQLKGPGLTGSTAPVQQTRGSTPVRTPVTDQTANVRPTQGAQGTVQVPRD